MKYILYDGTTTENFLSRNGGENPWHIDEDGAMTVTHDDIVSKVKFGDAHIHLEWREPVMPGREGQFKGNSGVYIQGCYELQVLDSYGVENPQKNDCGAIYEMYRPLRNACKPAGEWQTYDIYLRTARFDENDEMLSPARATIIQNGIVVQNNIILNRVTPGGLSNYQVAEGPLMLQSHYMKDPMFGDPVSYRNIWIETL